MPIIKSLFILIILFGSFTVSAQSIQGMNTNSHNTLDKSPGITDFVKFVGKTFSLSDSLKNSCEWMYAFVKVRPDKNNKVIKYEVLNETKDEIKNNFKFLIGYQFPKTMKINGRPIVFYFSIDNSELCNPKAGDFTYYYPNQVVEKMAPILFQLIESNRTAIFVPQLILKKYYAPIK